MTSEVIMQAVARLPEGPGVYRFLDERQRVIYLGRATSLRSRVASYAGKLGDRVHLRRMIPQVRAVQALTCASVHEATWLEHNLLGRSLPRWNRVRGGAEVVVWIELDRNPRRPGLRIRSDDDLSALAPGLCYEAGGRPPYPRAHCVHQFGPYLGVTKVRLGLAGIDRVWPLRLSGDTPDSANRALGEARAVSSADRDGFLTQITALLNRDPAVVRRHRDLLIAERDRVARSLAYELAQRIQEELEGVDWLTQPQRMTECTPADAVIHGWADGWLVSLSASHGRFNQWKVGQATADMGRGLAARTPPEWQAYAQANAELNAALATGFA